MAPGPGGMPGMPGIGMPGIGIPAMPIGGPPMPIGGPPMPAIGGPPMPGKQPIGGQPGPVGGPLRQLFGTAQFIVGLTKTGANWTRLEPPHGPPMPPQPALIW